MKLSIEKNELQRGLARVQAIVEKRNTMPILANVLLEASTEDEGSLVLIATDLEVGVRGSHPAKVEAAGSVTVSARKLFEIIRELPDEPVQIEVSDTSYLSIECARSRFSLAGTTAEEYPELPDFSTGTTVNIQAAVLGSMIERSIYAASVDETRYNLNGVFFEVLPETSKIRMVATDGHRLACVDRTVSEDVSQLQSGVIIPRKGLAELKRLVDEDDADEIELGFSANSGLARKGGVTLVMRLIEGEFPDYRQVIPKAPASRIILPTALLTQALRRVILLSAERSRAVRLEIGGGLLKLSSSSPELGDAHEELDVDYDGDDLSIGFNGRYLLDALAAAGSKEIVLGLQKELSPVQLQPTDDDDCLAVVMPMRI